MANSQLSLSFAAAASAGLLSGAIIWAIRPLLLHVALAKLNARSSYRVPTPQGAGIPVVAATLIVAATTALAGPVEMKIPIPVFGATLFIAAVGFADDVHSIPVFPRLLLLAGAVAVIVLAAPKNLRIIPTCPLWLERGLLLLAGRPKGAAIGIGRTYWESVDGFGTKRILSLVIPPLRSINFSLSQPMMTTASSAEKSVR